MSALYAIPTTHTQLRPKINALISGQRRLILVADRSSIDPALVG